MIESYKELLNEFEKLNLKPQKTSKSTFMNVSGYPHLENVTSNILAFLFNDSEEHGFKNLWSRSLLECAGLENVSNISNTWCNREVSTIKGNRIDLVMYSDSQIVTIENKIFSFVHNDLDDYKKTVSKDPKANELEQVDILLTIQDEHIVAEKHGFVNVTYDKLFNKVRQNYGEYIDEADSSWILYTRDFMYTIDNLQGGKKSTMDMEFAKFIYENKDVLNKFNNAVDNYSKEIKNEVEKIKNLLELEEILQGKKYSLFCYNSRNYCYSCICIDIERTNGILTVETFLDYNGWHITLFDRKGKKAGKEAIVSELNEKGISYEIIPNYEYKVQVEHCGLDEDVETLVEKIYQGTKYALAIL